MAIEHDYFGIIDETAAGGLAWDGHRRPRRPGRWRSSSRPTTRSAVPEYALDSAAALIQALEGFDARARDALIAELSSRAVGDRRPTSTSMSRSWGTRSLDLLVHNSGDIADRRAAVAAAAARGLPGRTTPTRRRCSRPSTTRSAPDETDALLTVSLRHPRRRRRRRDPGTDRRASADAQPASAR